VAEYLFSGNANDTSGFRHDGTVAGAVLTTDRFGVADSAYSFDGENDQISVPHTPALSLGADTSAFTLEAWVYPTAQKSQDILRKGSEVNGDNAFPYELALSGTGVIVGGARSAAGLTQVRRTGYSLNAWTHVALVWDGSSLQLYVNGSPEASQGFQDVLGQSTNPLLFGSRLQSPADTFAGKLDDIRLFNVARSPAQICQDAGISGTSSCP
jgi:hypothetical protein